jgi:hypothetical protein
MKKMKGIEEITLHEEIEADFCINPGDAVSVEGRRKTVESTGNVGIDYQINFDDGSHISFVYNNTNDDDDLMGHWE